MTSSSCLTLSFEEILNDSSNFENISKEIFLFSLSSGLQIYLIICMEDVLGKYSKMK